MQLASLGSSLTELDDRPPIHGTSPFVQVGGIGSDYLARWTGWTPTRSRDLFEAGQQEQARFQAGVNVSRFGVVRWGGNVSERVGLTRQEGANVAIAGGSTTTLLEHLEAHANILQRGIAGELSSEQTIAYLAVIRSHLEHDEIAAARHVLDAAPLDLSGQPVMQRLQKLLSLPRVTVSDSRDVDRSREYRWLREHGQRYRGRWVALEDENLIASASSLKELRVRLSELGRVRPPLIHHLQ